MENGRAVEQRNDGEIMKRLKRRKNEGGFGGGRKKNQGED